MDADEALKKVKQAAQRVAQAVAQDIANGADSKEVARQLAEVAAGLSTEEKLEYLDAIADDMSAEDLEELIANFEAILATRHSEDKKRPETTRPKKKKPKR